ncbi:HTH_Tnp_Tc3_2 domain-containing protein [Trichonephila clavipes]|nr:HTH_Tnp_Tc3_2 domain-containing protein [Trichonephila clavipes]
MQRDCALRTAGSGRLTSFSMEYKTGKTKVCLSVLNRLQSRAEAVLGPVDPRDVIYTKIKLRTPSIDQSSRRPPHRKKCTRTSVRRSPVAIQAQVASSLGAPVSSRTIRRRLAEGHLGSWRPLRVLPLTPAIDASVWSGAMHEETGLQWNGTRLALATNLD